MSFTAPNQVMASGVGALAPTFTALRKNWDLAPEGKS
jgi:hypothetical protein